jgi:two-component system, OmpR family, sensor kinase
MRRHWLPVNRHWPKWRYVRLRHRIFVTIVVSIVMTAVFAGLATHLLGLGSRRSEVAAMENFASARFSEVWNDEKRRTALASEVETDFGVTVGLQDNAGNRLYGTSRACRKPTYRLAISGAKGALGTLSICLRSPRFGVAVVFLGFFGGALVLWLLSGRIAWRLARPIDELMRVAREIGEGNLLARVRLRRHHRDEVGEIAEVVNEMAVRIEKQLSGQRELLAAVSHEIRTPLARLRVLVELERTAPEDPKRLDAIEAELIEIDCLVGQLLAQSKLDFSALDRRNLKASEVASAALVRASLGPGILRDASAEATISADPSLLARALANLIDNAERHGGGITELAVYREKDSIVFEVHDSGPGINAEVLPKLFAPFERGGKNAGLGLGLALVERIARAHGGRVSVKACSNGASVGFMIPVQS